MGCLVENAGSCTKSMLWRMGQNCQEPLPITSLHAYISSHLEDVEPSCCKVAFGKSSVIIPTGPSPKQWVLKKCGVTWLSAQTISMQEAVGIEVSIRNLL